MMETFDELDQEDIRHIQERNQAIMDVCYDQRSIARETDTIEQIACRAMRELVQWPCDLAHGRVGGDEGTAARSVCLAHSQSDRDFGCGPDIIREM